MGRLKKQFIKELERLKPEVEALDKINRKRDYLRFAKSLLDQTHDECFEGKSIFPTIAMVRNIGTVMARLMAIRKIINTLT